MNAPQSESVRYALLTLTMADGSNDTPDPDDLADTVRQYVHDLLTGEVTPSDIPDEIRHGLYSWTLTEAFYGDTIGSDDD